MGRVTFNGNVATPESQAYIRSAELAIFSTNEDEFVKARKVEFLYRDNGLEPGTFFRAGSVGNGEREPQQVSAYSSPSYSGGLGSGLMAKLIRWCIGFALIFFAVAWMNDFGIHTPEEDAAWAKYQEERCKAGNKRACK